MLNNPDYMMYLRERQASISIGASTARGMGPAGTILAARKFLMGLQLNRFQRKSEAAFHRELDLATEELRRCLPHKARKWGSARKFLNIFLRGCAYNKYLSTHFKLHLLEPWLEVPLDSHVATGLKKIAGRGTLPRWPGVINLKPADNVQFQRFATEIAHADGVNRVDIDIRFWRRVPR